MASPIIRAPGVRLVRPRRVMQQRLQQFRVRSVSAPARGWNARDPIDDMDEQDAVRLRNWVPGYSNIFVRPGYATFATGLSSSKVESMMVYDEASYYHLLAATNGSIYNITGGGSGPWTAIGSGFGGNTWDSVNFQGTLALFNGIDAPQGWNGTALTPLVLASTDPGFVATNLRGAIAFKSRVYLWENNSSRFWYSDLNNIGQLNPFPLWTIAKSGGIITNIVTWSRDGGLGPEDYIVFIMSDGSAIVYEGDDPSDATRWRLVGVYRIAATAGPKATERLAGDVIIISADGYEPLATALPGGRASTRTQISDRIQGAVLARLRQTQIEFSWQVKFYPLRNWLLVNVPVPGATHEQHVCNLRTGAWCEFTGIDSHCWELFMEQLYFGDSNGNVMLYDSGASDNGADIVADAVTAFTYMGTRQRKKMVHQLRVLASSDGDFPATVTVERDLGIDSDQGVLSDLVGDAATGAAWDVAEWGVTPWGGSAVSRERWLDRGGEGYSFATRIQYTGQGRNIEWMNQAYAYEYVAAV